MTEFDDDRTTQRIYDEIVNRLYRTREGRDDYRLDTIARKVMYVELHALYGCGRPLSDIAQAYPSEWGVGTAKGGLTDDEHEDAHLSFLGKVRLAEKKDQAVKIGVSHIAMRERAKLIAERKRPDSPLLTLRP